MKPHSSTSSSDSPDHPERAEPGLFRRIVVRVLVFLALLLPAALIANASIRYAGDYLVTGQNAGAIYFWGDSTNRRGVDLPKFMELWSRPAYSLAMDSAGPYDLFGFAARVPARSTVVLTPHPGMAVRPKERYYDRSGVSLPGLLALRESGASLNRVFRTLMNNRDPLSPRFRTSHYAWPDADSLHIPPEQQAAMEKDGAPADPAGRIRAWSGLFGEGVRQLNKRGVEVYIVAVPVSAEMKSIWGEELLTSFSSAIRGMADQHVTVYDEVPLATDRNAFYDLVHLNEHGRWQFTEFLLEHVR